MLLLAFVSFAFVLNPSEAANEQLKQTNKILRDTLKAMNTNKEEMVGQLAGAENSVGSCVDSYDWCVSNQHACENIWGDAFIDKFYKTHCCKTCRARYIISDPAQHCDDACASIGEECRNDLLYLTTAEQVESWAFALGITCASTTQRCDMGDSPILSGNICTFCNNPDHPGWTTRNACRSRWHGRQRICACTKKVL